MSLQLVRLMHEDGGPLDEDVYLSRLPCVGEEIQLGETMSFYRVVAVSHRAYLNETADGYAGSVRVVEFDWEEDAP